MEDLITISSSIVSDLNQLSNFIDQFHTFIIDKDLTITVAVNGDLNMLPPNCMPDVQAALCAKRVGVLDSLVQTKIFTITNSLEKARLIENELRNQGHTFASYLPKFQSDFDTIKNSYKG